MEEKKYGTSKPIVLSSSMLLADLFYCYKFELKQRYYSTLERLKPFLDEHLYKWFYDFAMNSVFFRKK